MSCCFEIMKTLETCSNSLSLSQGFVQANLTGKCRESKGHLTTCLLPSIYKELPIFRYC